MEYFKEISAIMKQYLCDNDNSQQVSFVERQVVLWRALKVVSGHTLCALRPRNLRRDGQITDE